jgi:hypothetical protein
MEIFVYISLVIIIGVGVAFLLKSHKKTEVISEATLNSNPDPTCCGAHEVCELDRIKMDPNIIEYYDDEELDVYKNINENDYSDEQIDKFREVLYTMQTNDIRFWLISLSRREINLPAILQEEARQLMSEK